MFLVSSLKSSIFCFDITDVSFGCGLSVQHGRSEPQEKVLHRIEDAEGDALLKLQPCPEGRSLEPLEDGPEDEWVVDPSYVS